jgi:L-amino acid N-acyltransferase YncA
MTPRIRPAQLSDIEAITRIYAQAVRDGTASFEIDPPDAAEMQRRFNSLQTGDYPYLVAQSGGAIAGYAYAAPYRARRGYRWSVEDSVYVAPEYFRRGVGRALLAALIEDAQARAFRQMVAVIGDSANTASVELHRKAGFRMVGTLENIGFKLGCWLDSVLMQRALGAGASTLPEGS